MARRTLNSSASKRKSAPSARRSRTTVARKRTAVGATTASRSNVRGKARSTAKRGFAAMTPARRRSIAAKGGRARAAA